MTLNLTDGEKLEVLKRFRRIYGEQLEGVEVELRALLTARAEYDFVKQYLGDQPEVKALLEQQDRVDQLEKRRQHIAMLIDRLDQVIPKGKNQNEAPNFKRF